MQSAVDRAAAMAFDAVQQYVRELSELPTEASDHEWRFTLAYQAGWDDALRAVDDQLQVWQHRIEDAAIEDQIHAEANPNGMAFK